MGEPMARVYRSRTYKAWFAGLNKNEQRIVDTRIDKYRLQDQLLNTKSLDRSLGLWEFKWKSGLRVYFSLIEDSQGRLMLLLLGGNKNTQAIDIKEARKIVRDALKGIEKKGKTHE